MNSHLETAIRWCFCQIKGREYTLDPNPHMGSGVEVWGAIGASSRTGRPVVVHGALFSIVRPRSFVERRGGCGLAVKGGDSRYTQVSVEDAARGLRPQDLALQYTNEGMLGVFLGFRRFMEFRLFLLLAFFILEIKPRLMRQNRPRHASC